MLTKTEFEIINNAPLNATHFISNIKSGVTNYAVKDHVDVIFSRCDGFSEFLRHAWEVEHCIVDLRKQHAADLSVVAAICDAGNDIVCVSISGSIDLCIQEMSDNAGSDKFIEYLKQLEQRDFTDKVKDIFKPKTLTIPWEFIDDAVTCAAMDEDCYIYFYTEKPAMSGSEWFLKKTLGDTYSAGVLEFDTDGIIWKESLTMRPSK